MDKLCLKSIKKKKLNKNYYYYIKHFKRIQIQVNLLLQKKENI